MFLAAVCVLLGLRANIHLQIGMNYGVAVCKGWWCLVGETGVPFRTLRSPHHNAEVAHLSYWIML